MFGLSFVHALAGHWPESFRAAERLENLSRPNDLVYAVAWGAYMQGNACLQMLDLEEAERYFSQAFERRYILNPRAATDALVGLALCRQLQRREAEADECLREAREFARWTGDPAYLDVVDSGRARIDLLRGDQDAAARWLAAFHGKPDVPVESSSWSIPRSRPAAYWSRGGHRKVWIRPPLSSNVRKRSPGAFTSIAIWCRSW